MNKTKNISITSTINQMCRIVLGGRFGEQSFEKSFEILDYYYSLGGNVIDTANSYANGKSEEVIGEWIREKQNRENIYIIDKGCHPYPDNKSRLTCDNIAMDLSESLERLKTSYIDIYLLHRDDECVEVGPLLEKLNEEKSRGRINWFGVSNWSIERIIEARKYAINRNIEGFHFSSCGFSLAKAKEPMWAGALHLDNDSIKDYLSFNIPLIAWSSQAKGWFSGAYINGKRKCENVSRVYGSNVNIERMNRVNDLAKIKGTTTIQIALAYVLSYNNLPTFALIGPENIEELKESFSSQDIKLDSDQIKFLEGTL